MFVTFITFLMLFDSVCMKGLVANLADTIFDMLHNFLKEQFYKNMRLNFEQIKSNSRLGFSKIAIEMLLLSL